MTDDEPVCSCGHEGHWHDERGCFYEEPYDDEDGNPLGVDYCPCTRRVAMP